MNASDFRKRLKPSSAQSLSVADKEANKKMGRLDSSNYEDDFIGLEDGVNLFRVYPPHPPGVDKNGQVCLFSESTIYTFVPALYPERDQEGNIIEGKFKKSVKMVYDTKFHGKLDKNGNPVCPDLVDEFIRIAKLNAEEFYSGNKDKKEEYLLPIWGRYHKDPNKRVQRLAYQQRWVMYVSKIVDGKVTAEINRLDIGKAIKNRINVLSAMEGANDPLGFDPFSGPDEARALKIVKNPDTDNPQEYYQTEIDSSTAKVKIGDKTVSVLRTFTMDDEEAKRLLDKTPLCELYRDIVKRSDIDMTIKGLQMLDEEYEMGIFDSEEFQNTVQEVLEWYPEEEDTKRDDTPTVNKEEFEGESEEESEETSESVGDKFDLMSRNELKEFIKEHQVGIIIKKGTSDDEIREFLRDWEDSPEEEEVEEYEDPEPQSKTEEEEQPKKIMSAKERLEALQKKRG